MHSPNLSNITQNAEFPSEPTYILIVKRLLFVARVLLGCSIFCFGPMVYGLFVLPFAYKGVEQRRKLAQQGLKFGFLLVQKLKIIKLEIDPKLTRELDTLAETKPAIIIANHPTIFDALILISFFPNAVCVAKSKLRRSLCFGPAILLLGYLAAEDGKQLLDNSATAIKSGAQLIIFPEGTRTAYHKKIGDFHRSAASIALRNNLPIYPLVLKCEPRILGRERTLWRTQPRTPIFKISILQPIAAPVQSTSQANLPLATRELTERLEMSYSSALSQI